MEQRLTLKDLDNAQRSANEFHAGERLFPEQKNNDNKMRRSIYKPQIKMPSNCILYMN